VSNKKIPLKWHTEQRKVGDLVAWDRNPRQMTEKQAKDLQTSIERFDLMSIPVINPDNTLISGHQRINIMGLLGRKDEVIDVRVPNRKLDDAEITEANLRENLNMGEWNLELLANFDEGILKFVGFNSKDLDRIFQLNARPDDDQAPAPHRTTIKLGDMFILGDHRLLCGDATKPGDYDRLMGQDTADMIFTDPPYNVDYQGGMNAHGKNMREGIKNDKMTQDQFYQFLYDFLAAAMPAVRSGIYICMGNSQIHTLKAAFEAAGGHWQNYIIWVKHHFTITRGDYQHQYEPIMYGWPKRTKKHYFKDDRSLSNVWEDLRDIKTEFKDGYTSIRFQGFEVKIKGKAEGTVCKKKQLTDIWRYDKPDRSPEHPTMKPVAMIAEAVANSSYRGGIVLDPFGGSGSTMIAAEKLNRKCYMMELDPRYCQVIIERWQEYTGKKAEKVNRGKQN
jgi:DNA modification methylase